VSDHVVIKKTRIMMIEYVEAEEIMTHDILLHLT